MEKNVCLVIIDGYGISETVEGNAAIESTYINNLKETEGHLGIFAHGKYVGLPDDKTGNSEVGHMVIGSGRVIKQSLVLINNTIKSGDMEKILGDLDITGKIHLIGMLSNGGVHSDVEHIAYVEECLGKKHNVTVHAISDGIDTASGMFLELSKQIKNIVSITGRHYAMDRDKNFERTDAAFNMMTGKSKSKILVSESEVRSAIEDIAKVGIEEEFIQPMLLKDEPVNPEDTVIFLNFRPDRIRQLYSNFRDFCKVYTIVEYEDGDENAILKKTDVKNTLSEWLSKHNKKQAHIAETEKYAHVTYFFNGGKEIKYDGEDWIFVSSPKVSSFTLAPGTAMEEVTERCCDCIDAGYDFIVVNLAAPDLLGHTGDLHKAKEAVIIADKQISRIHKKCIDTNYTLIITADHGNCEEMLQNGEICKAHTTNKVPFLALNSGMKLLEREDASLSDVAPSVLYLLGVDLPDEMTGKSLIG